MTEQNQQRYAFVYQTGIGWDLDLDAEQIATQQTWREVQKKNPDDDGVKRVMDGFLLRRQEFLDAITIPTMKQAIMPFELCVYLCAASFNDVVELYHGDELLKDKKFVVVATEKDHERLVCLTKKLGMEPSAPRLIPFSVEERNVDDVALGKDGSVIRIVPAHRQAAHYLAKARDVICEEPSRPLVVREDQQGGHGLIAG